MTVFRRSIALFLLGALLLMLLSSCATATPTVEINADAYWVINGVATNVRAAGADGKDGTDGATPTVEINANGYWVINGVATNVKAAGADGKDGKDGTDGTSAASGRYLHLSFDDVSLSLTNLATKTYSSLFDEPFFAWLRELHVTYGAKFSLYCFTSELRRLPESYAEEFLEAKDWLKLGLHAENGSLHFKNYTYEQGLAAWNSFVGEVVRITGSYVSVDRMPRLHMFAGSEAALLGMRDGNYGALGFLSTDDSRLPYYLNEERAAYLYTHDHITDRRNGLTFVATDLRLDWFISGFSSTNTYRAPTKTTVYDELCHRFSAVDYANSSVSLVVFTHEWQLYNGTALNSQRCAYVEDVCRFADDRGIRFSFPEDEAFLATPYDIH